MEKVKASLKIIAPIFVLIELTLGILIQKTGGDLCNALCFSSVVIAFLLSLLLLIVNRSYACLFTAIALLLTVVSDVFLVLVSPAIRVPAMFSFSVAQICYFLRIYLGSASKRERVSHLAARSAVIVISLVACAMVLRERIDLLSMVSMFYFANLLVNFAFAVWQCRRSRLLPIGLLFFILCDVFVGLSVMSQLYFDFAEGTLLYSLVHTGFNTVWFFYVPSQTLISLSAIKET